METHFLDNLKELFVRDLGKVGVEIQAFSSEEKIWELSDQIGNSSGTLALHLIGNLNHFIGSVLGNTGYVRQRDLEFSQRNIPRESILRDLQATIEMLGRTFSMIDPETLQADFPLQLGGKTLKTNFFLLHLYSHLNYHLGQINYHRRLLDR